MILMQKILKSIYKWMKEIAEEHSPDLLNSLKNTPVTERIFFNHLFLDGIFVLNKGLVYIDTFNFELPAHKVPEDHIWVYSKANELEFLWLLLNNIHELLFWNPSNLHEYIDKTPFTFDN